MSGPQSHSADAHHHHEQPPGRRPYSYLHTPEEVQAPTFPTHPHRRTASQQESNVQEDTNIDNSGHFSYTAGQAPVAMPLTHTHPQAHPTPPPISQHPAQFAPYAENTTPLDVHQPQPGYIPPTPQPPATNTATPPPLSPGPLPAKHNFQEVGQEQQRRESQLTIAPDNNPLTSPPHGSTFNYNSTPRTTQMGVTTGMLDGINHTPGQAMHPQQELKGGTWKHGLCDCTDIGTCCTGLLCPCILYGRTQYRLSMKSSRKDPTNLLGYETCNASCTVMALLCGCQWLFATIQHYRTRRAYDIPGGVMSDCVRSTCCTCCTLIQDEREIKSREEGVLGTTVNTPYTTPAHMSFNPPPR